MDEVRVADKASLRLCRGAAQSLSISLAAGLSERHLCIYKSRNFVSDPKERVGILELDYRLASHSRGLSGLKSGIVE